MKKTILFLLIITSLYAESKLYLGLSHGTYNEKFTKDNSAECSGSVNDLKVGYGDVASYAIEFSLEHLENTSNIFSNNDYDKYGLNIDLLKSFDFGININPFFKAGFGAGHLGVKRATQDTLHYGTLNLGVGVFIPLNEHFDFELGYRYKHISYEGVDIIVDNISYSSNSNTAYFGFNTRF